MYFHQKKLLTNSQKISKSKNYNFTNYRIQAFTVYLENLL